MPLKMHHTTISVISERLNPVVANFYSILHHPGSHTHASRLLLHAANSYPLSFYSLYPAGPWSFTLPTAFSVSHEATASFHSAPMHHVKLRLPWHTSPICGPQTTLNVSWAVLLLPMMSLCPMDPHTALSASGIVSLLRMTFLYPMDPFTALTAECAWPVLHHIIAILPACCLIVINK